MQEEEVALGRLLRLNAKGGRRPPFASLVAAALVAVGATAAADPVSESGVTHDLAASARPHAVVAEAAKGERRTGVALTLGFEISTSDGGGAPALRRARVEIDDDIRFDPRGVDRCGRSAIEGRDSAAALAACATAQVGQGTAMAICPATAGGNAHSLVLAVFNAGKGKRTGLLVHAGSSTPDGGFPAVFGTRITRRNVLALPGAATEDGCTLQRLELTLEKRTRYEHARGARVRDYVTARCPDGRWILRGAFEYAPNPYGVDRLEPRETVPCRGKKLAANP